MQGRSPAMPARFAAPLLRFVPLAAPLALAAVVVLASGGTARAAAMAPEPMPVPLPGVEVDGPAQIDERRVQVRCRDLGDDAFACDVELRFRLTALGPVHVRRMGDATWSVDGEAVEVSGDELWLAPREAIGVGGDVGDDGSGEATREPSDGMTSEVVGEPAVANVVLRFGRTVSIGSVDRESFWVLSPVRGRHLLLGDGGDVRREGSNAFGELFSGEQVTFVGELTTDVAAPDAVAVNLGGQPLDGVSRTSPPHHGLLLAAIPEPEGEPSPIQHGGPVLALGTRLNLSDEDDSRFLLRGAYELAVAGHFIGSVSFETDFDSIYESLVLEAASPEILVIIPSFAAGVGVVARQLGNRDADAALRLRLGVNFIAIGVTADFDYWPAIGAWTSMIVGRISL